MFNLLLPAQPSVTGSGYLFSPQVLSNRSTSTHKSQETRGSVHCWWQVGEQMDKQYINYKYIMIIIPIIMNLPLYTLPSQSPQFPLTIHQASQFITSPPSPSGLHLPDMIVMRKERRKTALNTGIIGLGLFKLKKWSSLYLIKVHFLDTCSFSLFLSHPLTRSLAPELESIIMYA